jgi:hypothetical protein
MEAKHLERGLAAVAAVALVACGGDGDGDRTESRPGGEAELAPAPVVDPAVAATIRGVVAFEGEALVAVEIDMSEEPACAEKYTAGPPMTHDVVAENGRLANVFVYVKEGLEGTFPVPADPVVLDQDGCRYHPHVLGIQVGQTLLVRNSDPTLHNINAQPSVNRGFNISQPQAGMESRRDFRRPEVMIPVKCDVHGWMGSYIGVLDHPYHSVSAADGSFSLSPLPPGTYVIEGWHEVYGTAKQEVTVGDGETAEISFTFSADMAADTIVPLGEPVELHADHHGTAVYAGNGIRAAGRE